jgi:hypothetical protein
MKILEMKLAGTMKKGDVPSHFAVISRIPGNETIRVKLIRCDGEVEHKVMADDETDVFSMAEILQECLDGRRGTNSDIHSYYCLLQHFMD